LTATTIVERTGLQFGTSRDFARRDRESRASASECLRDGDCAPPTLLCRAVDRNADFDASVSPARRLCVGYCVRGRCPAGHVCRPEGLCAPEPIDGSGLYGDPCLGFSDCSRSAPYCVVGPEGHVCARACGEGCPDGASCVPFHGIGTAARGRNLRYEACVQEVPADRTALPFKIP